MSGEKTVPAEPFAEILRPLSESLVAAGHNAWASILSKRTGVSDKILRRVINREQERLSFDNADKIVTRLCGPMAWYEDDVLSAIYQGVDLAAVDHAFPIGGKPEPKPKQPKHFCPKNHDKRIVGTYSNGTCKRCSLERNRAASAARGAKPRAKRSRLDELVQS